MDATTNKRLIDKDILLSIIGQERYLYENIADKIKKYQQYCLYSLSGDEEMNAEANRFMREASTKIFELNSRSKRLKGPFIKRELSKSEADMQTLVDCFQETIIEIVHR